MARERPPARPRPSSPRIPPLAPGEGDEQAEELLASVGFPGLPPGSSERPAAANIFTTLVRHPGLFRRWLPFGGKLLAGRLPARDRELLILRTAWLCRAEYEWGQHARIALTMGVTGDEVDRVGAGPDDPGWSAFDATLVRAADELHDDACISDATWAALADRYDERQLIEVPMVVGHYHLVAFTLNSLGVPLDPGVTGFER
jgi:alkylhydroperoxidase family enzyme